MKKYILLPVFFTVQSLFAALGCMDNSYRLTQAHDSKDYHYVTCNCPCEKKYNIIERKSICEKCRHYRDPRYSAMLIEYGPVNCPRAFSDFACTNGFTCAKSCQE